MFSRCVCIRRLYNRQYFLPNTPGLRALQYGDTLSALLDGLKVRQQRLSLEQGKQVPLLVKIAPDMTDDEISDFAQRIINSGMDGIIATNTTLSREGIEGVKHADETGGLSGAPVKINQHTPLKS